MAHESTDQFQLLSVEMREPKRGFAMCIAVWKNEGKHTVIGAPSRDGLRDRWKQITGEDLVDEIVQRVIVTSNEVPEDLFEQAQAAVRQGSLA